MNTSINCIFRHAIFLADLFYAVPTHIQCHFSIEQPTLPFIEVRNAWKIPLFVAVAMSNCLSLKKVDS